MLQRFLLLLCLLLLALAAQSGYAAPITTLSSRTSGHAPAHWPSSAILTRRGNKGKGKQRAQSPARPPPSSHKGTARQGHGHTIPNSHAGPSHAHAGQAHHADNHPHGPSGHNLERVHLKGHPDHYPGGHLEYAWAAPAKYAEPSTKERQVMDPHAPHAGRLLAEIKKLHEDLPGAALGTRWSMDDKGKISTASHPRHPTGLRLDNQGGVAEPQRANIQIQRNGSKPGAVASSVSGMGNHKNSGANHFDFANALSASLRTGKHVHLTHPDFRPAGHRRDLVHRDDFDEGDALDQIDQSGEYIDVEDDDEDDDEDIEDLEDSAWFD